MSRFENDFLIDNKCSFHKSINNEKMRFLSMRGKALAKIEEQRELFELSKLAEQLSDNLEAERIGIDKIRSELNEMREIIKAYSETFGPYEIEKDRYLIRNTPTIRINTGKIKEFSFYNEARNQAHKGKKRIGIEFQNDSLGNRILVVKKEEGQTKAKK